MADRLSIKNDALSELPSAPITAEDEQSLEAAETERVYDQALKELLEAHDWGFANRRVALAVVANTRDSEWLYAYAVPADMGTPKGIVPDWEGMGLGIPVEGLFTPPYYEVWSGAGSAFEYLIENGVIYTNVENAAFEYGASTVSEAVMPAMFARALALEIASRIAMPIKKDRELKGDLIKQAEAAKARAMADDENRNPRRHGIGYVSEAAMARAGYGL